MFRYVVIVASLLVGFLSGALGWSVQLTILYFAFLCSSFYLIKKNKTLKKQLQWISLLLGPWILMYGSVVILDRQYHVTVILITPIIAVLLSYLFHFISCNRFFIPISLTSTTAVFFGLYIANVNQIDSTLLVIKSDYERDVVKKFAKTNLLSDENKTTLVHFWSVDCAACFKDFSAWERLDSCAVNSKALSVRHIHLAGSEYEKKPVQVALDLIGIDSYIIENSTYYSALETESLYNTLDIVGVPAFLLIRNKAIVVAGNASFTAFSNYNVISIVAQHLYDEEEQVLNCINDVVSM